MGKTAAAESGKQVDSNGPLPGWRSEGRPWSLRWIRTLLAAGLVTALFYFGIIDIERLLALLAAPGHVLAAFMLLLVASAISVVRWTLLLRVQGVLLPFRRCWHFVFIGLFANTFLPGGIGGDAMRIYLTARDPQCRTSQALVSVVADRMLGLAGLITVATVLLFANINKMTSSPILWTVAAFTFGLAAAAVVGFLAALVLGHRPRFRNLVKAAVARFHTVERYVTPVLEAVRVYHEKVGTLLLAFGLSIIVHMLVTLTLLVLFSAMHLPGLTALDLGLAGMLSYLVNIVPLTPGGLGVGEGVFDQLCRLMSQTGEFHPYGSAFFSARLVGTLVALLGVVSYVVHTDATSRIRQ